VLLIIENERARMRTVDVGHRNGLVAEIVKGIAEGKQAIVPPDDRLEEGSRVRIK
jgi:HlyD family secretion protein